VKTLPFKSNISVRVFSISSSDAATIRDKVEQEILLFMAFDSFLAIDFQDLSKTFSIFCCLNMI